MPKDTDFSQQWEKIVTQLSNQFADGDRIDMESIMYLIGIQELGKGFLEFSKDDKINLMHIAICKLLEPMGYYKFDQLDEDGWPHYNLQKEVPKLSKQKQTEMMQKAIIDYFN